MQTKHALIIGINTYLFMEPAYQLKGCVNDAKLIQNVLINKFNFDPANILLLLDEQATLQAIQNALEAIIERLQKDDIFVFHFSGHGGDCNIHTEFTDEGSGKENCILPCDDSEPGEDGKPIYREVRDGQFSEYLKRIALKTQYTTLIFDACYSGTMTRSQDLVAKTRYVPALSRANAEFEPSLRSHTNRAHQDSSASTLMNAPVSKGAGGWLQRSDSYTVISASRDSQKAKEWHFDIGGASVRHGLLSFFLARALVRSKPMSTYRDIFEKVSAGIVSMVTEQNPQIEGLIDREIFGTKEIEPLSFVPVLDVEENVVTLGGGLAQGIHAGSRYKLYPIGCKIAADEHCLGLIEIIQVSGLSSTAKVIEHQAPLTKGLRCVELDGPTHVEPISISVAQLSDADAYELRALLQSSKLMRVAQSQELAEFNVNVCESKTQLEDILPETLMPNEHSQVAFPCWVVTRQDGDLAMRLIAIPEGPSDSVQAIKDIHQNFETIAKFRNVMQLENPQSDLKVQCNLIRLGLEGEQSNANGGSSEFAEGELMSLEVKNLEPNRSVFFSILWMGADRQILQFYPRNRTCEELISSKTVRIGSTDNKLFVSLPEQHFSDVGCVTWKVMFATKETDFGLLNQDGLRSRESDNSLDAFDIAFTGEQAPSHTEHEENGPTIEHDWCAINRSFVVTRARQ